VVVADDRRSSVTTLSRMAAEVATSFARPPAHRHAGRSDDLDPSAVAPARNSHHLDALFGCRPPPAPAPDHGQAITRVVPPRVQRRAKPAALVISAVISASRPAGLRLARSRRPLRKWSDTSTKVAAQPQQGPPAGACTALRCLDGMGRDTSPRARSAGQCKAPVAPR